MDAEEVGTKTGDHEKLAGNARNPRARGFLGGHAEPKDRSFDVACHTIELRVQWS